MAVFYPTLREIFSQTRITPEPGEAYLLRMLDELDNDYHIYFQSHINYAHPDIVITHPQGGVFIIEVKDWNLHNYQITPNQSFGEMRINNAPIQTPFEQAKEYKEELFLLSNELYKVMGGARRKYANDKRAYGLVRSAVFFYCSSETEVQTLFQLEDNGFDTRNTANTNNRNANNRNANNANINARNTNNTNSITHDRFPNVNGIFYFGRNTSDIIEKIKKVMAPKSLFTNTLYQEIESIFTMSREEIEQNTAVHFDDLTNEQKRFAVSSGGEQKKIKGVAGSGKTWIIAARAISAYARTHNDVLILTFNITLKNYIMDMIMRFCRGNEELAGISRSKAAQIFHVYPIHDFAKAAIQRTDLKITHIDEENNIPDEILRRRFQLLRSVPQKVQKFDTILVDEVQDYKTEWLQAIKEIFLKADGEYILFGDEKQNVYGRVLENFLPRTPIPGAWNILRESFRSTDEIVELSDAFARQFLPEFVHDDMEHQQMTLVLDGERRSLEYYRLSENENHYKQIMDKIEEFRVRYNNPISPNDICILAENAMDLRCLVDQFKARNVSVQSMVLGKNDYDFLMQHAENAEKGKFEVMLEERKRKNFMNMNAGVMKVSTIQSFKGWEINTIVLLVNGRQEAVNRNNVLYTAITRAKRNLLVLDCNGDVYGTFFRDHMEVLPF